MKVKVIYDFADEWPRLYPFIFFGVSLFCIFYFGRTVKRYRKEDIPFIRLFTDRNFIGSILMGLFCLLSGYLLLNPQGYLHTKAVYKNAAFKQTLGYVVNFKDRHYSKYRVASFTLNGLSFEFTDNNVLYGCHYKPVSNSGIRDSSLLKIYYFTDDGTNRVLRLETFK